MKISGADTTMEDEDVDVLKNLADSIKDLLSNIEVDDQTELLDQFLQI